VRETARNLKSFLLSLTHAGDDAPPDHFTSGAHGDEQQAHLSVQGRSREAPRGARRDGHGQATRGRQPDPRRQGARRPLGNAEYEDAKNEQAFVEGRIQTLEAIIKNATIIDENHSTDHVQIGSTVGVETPDGKDTFTIVGSAEAKPAEGRISNESPVGRALLGKKKGEKVVVKVPAGDFTYKILSIS
jgi:transcription elongation factor GreA